MRTVEIGERLVSVVFLVKYKSECKPKVLFWENSSATTPSSLIEVVSTFLEVYVDEITTLTWPGVIEDNSVTFNLTEADTTLVWDSKPFNLIFMKPNRNVVLSGEVQVQR